MVKNTKPLESKVQEEIVKFEYRPETILFVSLLLYC